MCLTCDFDPCKKNCPEAYGFPKAVCVCSYCGDTVYMGDRVRLFSSGLLVFHEECLSEMRGDELADFQETEIQVMQ